MTLPERLLLYARQFEDQHAPETITLALREAAGAISHLMKTHDDMADEIERLRAALEDVIVHNEWPDRVDKYARTALETPTAPQAPTEGRP